jgi:hypothetical protein
VDGQNPGCVPYVIRGYAMAGGGRRIERVDLSLDGGFTWVRPLAPPTDDVRAASSTDHQTRVGSTQVTAELERHGQDYGADVNRHWAWTLWRYNVQTLPSPCDIVCKACTYARHPCSRPQAHTTRGARTVQSTRRATRSRKRPGPFTMCVASSIIHGTGTHAVHIWGEPVILLTDRG